MVVAIFPGFSRNRHSGVSPNLPSLETLSLPGLEVKMMVFKALEALMVCDFTERDYTFESIR